MDFTRLPRFASLFVNESREIDGPSLLATAVPAEMLASDEWAMLLDGRALMMPRALAEPIEHELALADPGSWTLGECIALVDRGEGEFRYRVDDDTETVLLRPWRSSKLMQHGALCFYLGRDDRALEEAATDFAQTLRDEVIASAQREIRLLERDNHPILVASSERYLYRLDEKRLNARLLSQGDFEVERLLATGHFDYDVDDTAWRLEQLTAAARTQRPVVLGFDGHPRAVMFRES